MHRLLLLTICLVLAVGEETWSKELPALGEAELKNMATTGIMFETVYSGEYSIVSYEFAAAPTQGDRGTGKILKTRVLLITYQDKTYKLGAYDYPNVLIFDQFAGSFRTGDGAVPVPNLRVTPLLKLSNGDGEYLFKVLYHSTPNFYTESDSNSYEVYYCLDKDGLRDVASVSLHGGHDDLYLATSRLIRYGDELYLVEQRSYPWGSGVYTFSIEKYDNEKKTFVASGSLSFRANSSRREFQSGSFYLNDRDVNLRSAPGVTSKVIRKIQPAGTYKPIDIYPIPDTVGGKLGYWVLIETDKNELGYVWSQFLETAK